MKRLGLGRRLAGLLLVAGCVVGCCAGPRVSRLDATPRVLCPGETAVVRWEANGELAMAVRTEPTPATDSCAAAGRDTLALTLVARKHGEEAQQTVEVMQLQTTAAEPVVIRTNAIEGTDVVARDEKNVALWGDRVEVATVAACGGRDIDVRHAGRTAKMPGDGSPSDALAGTTLTGPWELRSPLSRDEQKDPSRRPKELKVFVTVRCKPEGL